MAQAASQHQPAISPEANRFGRVAAGGPIAEIQRTIEERMMAIDWQALQPAAATDDGGALHRVSRAAGPALLAVAYAAVAIWWF